MSKPRVLSVGQCGFDHAGLSRHLAQQFGAEVVAEHSTAGALRALQSGTFDLVLVNRVFDADGSSGLELIRSIKGDSTDPSPPLMLVSNHPDAQDQAVALGALPGFGKAELSSPQTRERLAAALAPRSG